MGSLRFLTAGESHGPGLVAIIEGLPAGLQVSRAAIEDELRRRRLGHGRGPRMAVERDHLEVLGGVRSGMTLGSPVALLIRNTEWEAKWSRVMPIEGDSSGRPLTRPRPGHADLVGMLKYDFDDARNVLERASARETAARVGVGALAKAMLAEVGAGIVSHVVAIGAVSVDEDAAAPGPEDRDAIDASPVRCFDPAAGEAMVREIDAAAADGDSVGGVVEVLAAGLPPGLGSHVHWDRRLDARIAQAMMSVPAIKGVEIGRAFRVASQRGSASHDEIAPGLTRASERAGGTEGGMSMGGTLSVRVAMKPLSTLKRRLRTVDMRSGEAAEAFQERTDTCAVPAAGVVCESVLALVLGDALLEMFGGDTMTDLKASYSRYIERIRERGRT